MKSRKASILVAVAVCLVLAVTVAWTAEPQSGTWSMTRSDEPGKVYFSLHYDHGSSSSDWLESDFQGVDLVNNARHEVRFTITRDAGRFDCDGQVESGKGTGFFKFVPNQQYVEQMKSLGFTDTEQRLLPLALHDVSIKFATEMKNAQLRGLDTEKLLAFRIHGVNGEFMQGLKSEGVDASDSDHLIAFRIHGVSKDFVHGLKAEGVNVADGDKLVAFRIHGVSPEFVHAMKAEGLNVPESDKLVAFRVHNVTPELVRALRQASYSPTADQLVALRIHGASPEWVGQIAKLGYDKVEIEKLVAFRIHGVSPEFIQKIQQLGYHPSPDELIAMRIHNVTPEYISELKSKGMNNLTIQQLVSLRIHGID